MKKKKIVIFASKYIPTSYRIGKRHHNFNIIKKKNSEAREYISQ